MCNSFNKKFSEEAALASKINSPEQNIDHAYFMGEAIREAMKGVGNGAGGPFGCVIVKEGKIIGRGHNQVTSSNDPTGHAEIVAIREACKKLKSFQLEDCIIYASCEPCPMCLGAIYWARPAKVYYSGTKHDAKDAGFDDQFIYEEINRTGENRSIPFFKFEHPDSGFEFEKWKMKVDKIKY